MIINYILLKGSYHFYVLGDVGTFCTLFYNTLKTYNYFSY